MRVANIFLAIIVCIFVAILNGVDCRADVIKVEPEKIDIGAFYHGTTLKVSGYVPSDVEIVVRFKGISHDVHLKRKGKIFGLLWMNIDPVTFKETPNAFLVYASSADTLKILGLESLANEVQVETKAKIDKKQLFREFLKLKKSEELYGEFPGRVKVDKIDDTKKAFSVSLDIPARLTPGEYKVQVFTVKNGQVMSHNEKVVPVKLVGFPAFLSSLAFNHGGWYGVIATLIAIMAGLAMGVIFGGKGGAH